MKFVKILLSKELANIALQSPILNFSPTLLFLPGLEDTVLEEPEHSKTKTHPGKLSTLRNTVT
jgi:hypothetical protein